MSREKIIEIEAALLAGLTRHGIPHDVQALLVLGDGRGTVAPGALRAALAALEAAGYAIVPVEPTEEMSEAGAEVFDACNKAEIAHWLHIDRIYRAMLKSAKGE